VFTTFAWTLADVQPQLQAACEGDWSMDKLACRRRAHLEHGAPVQPGRRLTAKDDDLPPRLKTEPAKTGPAKGHGQRCRQDDARVLQGARLDAGRRAGEGTLSRLGRV
jgi:aldehyde:ferredoxin oxidoreductase